jgi:predicted nucleic acid-binding protein
MALTVDASVVVKWYIDEVDSPIAHRLLEDGEDLMAPGLLAVEVCSVAWRHARGGDITRAQGLEIAEDLGKGLIKLHATAPLAPRATAMALDLDHAIYDCFYLALADREGATLVTADHRFLDKLERSPWRHCARPLRAL